MSSLEYKVVDKGGNQTGTIELDSRVFQAPVLEHVVHEVVTWQLAKRRAGTHSTLNLDKIDGGGRKPWKQKGTGRARAGSIRSPLWKGGGVTFGPSNERNYKRDIPAKMKRKALLMALALKAKDNELIVLEDFLAVNFFALLLTDFF